MHELIILLYHYYNYYHMYIHYSILIPLLLHLLTI